MSAIKEYGYNIEFVPPAFKTDEICLLAIQNGRPMEILPFIPEENRTEDVYIELIKYDTDNFYDVPYDKRTYNIYFEMAKNGCIYLVPQFSFLDENLVATLKKVVPNDIVTDEMKSAYKEYYEKSIKNIYHDMW